MADKLSGKGKAIAIILAIIILILILSFSINLHDSLANLERKKIYAEVIVADHSGFNVNGTALMFGMVIPGGNAVRDIRIGNEHNKDVRIKINVIGDIGRFISVSDNNFILKEGESKEISFIASIPEKTAYGKYAGEVIVNTGKT